MVPLRVMLAFSAGFNLELHHLDIETAFLYGHDLNEEIFMQQPPFFEDSKLLGVGGRLCGRGITQCSDL